MNLVPVNIITATDSYKLTHPGMLREGTSGIYSYYSHRGGPYDWHVFAGLQAVLKKYFVGTVLDQWMIEEAEQMHRHHFPAGNTKFDRAAWVRILNVHNGRLPLKIRARREGSVTEAGTVLFTIENTDPLLPVTNHFESLLLHTWYPSTTATVSFDLRQKFRAFLPNNNWAGLEYMLHDFGYRGTSSHESAGIGGLGHLLSFKGTDTLEAMRNAKYYYNAKWNGLAHSVPATEHSIMTSEGYRFSDVDVLKRLIPLHANGILSVVADSYDYQHFVREAMKLKWLLVQHNVKLVIRPDSVSQTLRSPSDVVLWTLNQFKKAGMTELDPEQSDLRLIDPSYAILWGDGLSPDDILGIVQDVTFHGYSVKNLVFGMGGGLLQKVNRDTLKTAIKSSAQEIDGKWHDVYKETYGKQSLRGRFDDDRNLSTVFDNGTLVREWTFDELRATLREDEEALKLYQYMDRRDVRIDPKVEMFTGAN